MAARVFRGGHDAAGAAGSAGSHLVSAGEASYGCCVLDEAAKGSVRVFRPGLPAPCHRASFLGAGGRGITAATSVAVYTAPFALYVILRIH